MSVGCLEVVNELCVVIDERKGEMQIMVCSSNLKACFLLPLLSCIFMKLFSLLTGSVLFCSCISDNFCFSS